MNYFQLVNKCLVELNYKQVNSFAELTKNDHKKIKNILRLVNNDICNYQNWNFRIRKTELILPAETSEIKNLIRSEIDNKVNAENGFRTCERIYSFCILSESFKIGEELSGKQEYMRHKINAKYKKKIELLFQDK